MGKKEFNSFLNQESEENTETVNWESRLMEWKKFIDLLYSDVNDWLSEYTQSRKVTIKTHAIEIYEETIGKYTIKAMDINVGNNLVTLKPIGTVLIGTIGRVDVIGKSGTQKFILAGKDSSRPEKLVNISISEEGVKEHHKKIKESVELPLDWEWKITSNPPRIKYTELNQETFLECLMSVING